MSVTPQSLDLTSYVAGTPIASSERLEVRNPYNNQRVGSVTLATRAQTARRRAAHALPTLDHP